MMRWLALLLLYLPVCPAQQTRLTTGGGITGVLRGDDGTAIVGAIVELQRRPPFPPGRSVRTEWSTQSGAGGTFSFDGLYGGPYRLCAQVPGSTWLNPCEWGLQPPAVSLSTTQPSASVTMVMKKGAAVPIRVDDPGRWLAQHKGKTPGAHVLLHVGDDA